MAADAKRAIRPHPQQLVKCPRCESPDTKFCYYNNYSTTQPRYFCKNCKRYWTEGGTLRNVPVGGGLRKNKRSKTKQPTTSSPPLPPSSHHRPPSSTPSACNINHNDNHNNMAASHGLPNLSKENNHGLPHSSSLANPGYLVFNPRIYEGGDQATPHASLPYQELNYNHQAVPPPSLSILGGLKQQEHPSIAPFFGGYGPSRDHERPLSESLQPSGLYHSHDTSANNYTMNNFVSVSDWQQISEGLFGGGGEGNFLFMQPPQAPQWSDFDSGTRL